MQFMTEDANPFDTALAVTQTITEAGYGLLPRQPTAKMVEAGMQASGMTADQVRLAYDIMHKVGLNELGVAANDPIALMQRLLMSQQAN